MKEIFKNKSSLRAKSISYIGLCVIGVMMLFALISFLSQRTLLKSEQEKRIEVVAEKLVFTMSQPLWNYDRDYLLELIDQELTTPEISAIAVVLKDDKLYLGKMRQGEKSSKAIEIFSIDQLKDANLGTQAIKVIKRNGNDIGAVKLFVTDRFINKQLMLNSLQEITKGLLMLGCISFLVFLGMNRTVLSPLQKLNATAYELEQGNFAARVSDVGADEIGQLGSAINSMAASLEESIRKRDNLLGELGERSVELLGAKEEAEVLARERGEALLSLQASRELQRLIAQNVSDLIWAIDLSYRHTYANPAVERILGWTVEEYLSMSIENVLPPESLALAFSAIDEEKSWNELPNADQNRSKTLELEHYRKDGSKFMAEITASFLLNDDGTPAGIIGITRDITERRNLEQQVIQQQKLEGIGMLAGGVAHDINNLLTPIYFSLEMAERAIEPGHKALVRLQTIQKAATRIRDLVRQLLVFSRKQQAQVETLDLNEVVSTFIGILRRTMRENIDIEQQLDTGSCLIKADRTQLEQIIMNLAVNAQDAIDGVGRINIETGKYRLDEEYCKSYAGTVSGEYVILTFTDNGCGMDEVTRKKVFEPFFTTKPVGKGTGLGLSTVYGIVRQHGGHIDILSHPGKGSTFRVFLPVAKGSADIEVNPELAEIVVPSFTGTLLLVEDNDMLRESLHEALHGSGIKTMAASSPMEAIAIFKEHHNEISVLLTDMVMPEMNGPELYHSLTKLKEGLPVIFMSGYASDIDNYPEIVDNPDIFMTKPFMIQSLLTKLAKV